MLETKRLILREWKAKDASQLFKLASSPNISRPCGFLPHKNEEDSKGVIKNILKKPEHYAIILKARNCIVGSINLKLKNISALARRNNEVELGYFIGESFWGKGYAKEACRKLIEHAFLDLNIKTIWASHKYDNVKSLNLLKSLNFKYIYSKILYMPAINRNYVAAIRMLKRGGQNYGKKYKI